jgi:hypothetical protein
MAMIGLVIGVNLIAPINTATSVIITPTYSAAVNALAALLPLLFVVILMIFAVKAID